MSSARNQFSCSPLFCSRTYATSKDMAFDTVYHILRDVYLFLYDACYNSSDRTIPHWLLSSILFKLIIVGIQFGNRCNNCVIKLNGNEIKWQRSVKHLGNIIDQKLSDVEDCRFMKSILIGNVNKFIGNYSTLKNCSKRKLFQSYCTSFYGSELWSLSSKGLEECV